MRRVSAILRSRLPWDTENFSGYRMQHVGGSPLEMCERELGREKDPFLSLPKKRWFSPQRDGNLLQTRAVSRQK